MNDFPNGSIVLAAKRFADRVAAVDKTLRRSQQTIPPTGARQEVTAAFWSLVETLHVARDRGHANPDDIQAMREIAGAWLFRSRLWNRAHQKPHGYPGDFMMVEWMYELENDSCADPYQPGIVNCLDGLMKTVHSVVSVWERRAWFARLLREEHERRGGQLSVLDVAAGGARYLRDFLGSTSFPNQIRVTVVDQDAAAVEFCRRRSLAPWSSQIRFECAPIRNFATYVPTAPFDVILSAGLFDYLDGATAAALLRQMTGWLSPSGTLAISNFHPDDPSALVKSWLVNWPLVFREEHECAELFPRDVSVRVSRSANRALCFATAVRGDE